MINFLGLYGKRVYCINREYVDLYESTYQYTRDLNEPLTNIGDGMMYFYRLRAADYPGNWSDNLEAVQLSTLSNHNANVAERFM